VLRRRRYPGFEREPGHVEPGFDGLVAESFEEERFAALTYDEWRRYLPAELPFQPPCERQRQAQ
jgi:hypothetical protein